MGMKVNLPATLVQIQTVVCSKVCSKCCRIDAKILGVFVTLGFFSLDMVDNFDNRAISPFLP